MPLFDLPNELLESILILCDPIDVARVSQTCRDFRNLVYRGPDDALWRSLYVAHLQLDDPRQCVAMDGQPRPPIKWKEELQRAIRVRTLVTTNSAGKPGEIGIILQTLLDLTTLVRPLALDSFPKSLSMSLVAIPALLRHGWIDLVEREPLEERERQMVARFHTYYGLTQNDMRKESWIRSRSFVYNFRNYSVRNDFGPFFDNGTVNWVHARALHHVMSMQVLEQQGISNDPEEFEYALYPMSLPFTQIVVPAKDEHDWLDITGEWEVSFIFIDHRVLLRYNESIMQSGFPASLHASVFEEEEFEEVFRTMKVDLQLVRTEADPEHPDHPVIHFSGVMRNFVDSVMIGKAWMTREGYVRWRFCFQLSGERREPIWSSEGLQIGGLRSAYGVLGAWTTRDHDFGDPVGPFWMRKSIELGYRSGSSSA